jgi:hypothetical protein
MSPGAGSGHYLTGDVADAVANLKQQPGRDIVMYSLSRVASVSASASEQRGQQPIIEQPFRGWGLPGCRPIIAEPCRCERAAWWRNEDGMRCVECGRRRRSLNLDPWVRP